MEPTLLIDDRLGRLRRGAFSAMIRAGTRPFLRPRVPLRVSRTVMDRMGALASPLPSGSEVDELDLDGVRTWRVRTGTPRPGRFVFAVHGGGYVYGGLGTHGGGYARLAQRLDATLVMPDYRLLPEHDAGAPLEDAVTAWQALVDRLDVQAAVVTGDSAGAGIALGLACEARDRGLRAPEVLALQSPWVDASPEVVARREPDAILGRATMQHDLDRWLSGGDADDPIRSPIRRDLRGLPPTIVQWGHGEALHEDSVSLVAALHDADVDVAAEAYAHLWHVAFLHVPTLAEANAWLDRTAALCRPHLG